MITVEPHTNSDLAQRLSEAEATIEALLSGQIDAVVDLKNSTPVLLAKAQEALRTSEERYRRIVETTNEGVWVVDAENKTTFMNRRMAQMLGCEEDMGMGRSPFEFLDGAGRANMAAHIQMPGKQQMETRYIRGDGTSLWALVGATALSGSAGRYDGMLFMVMDITDRRKAALDFQELSERTARRERVLTATLSSITDFAYIYDKEGRFLFANQPLLDLWGITLEDVVGKNFFDLGYPKDLAELLQGQVRQVIETKKSVVGETAYTNAAGQGGYYEYIFSPVLGADGAVESVAGSTREITGRKKAEVELRLLNQRLSLATSVAKVGVWDWDLSSNTLTWDATMYEIYGIPPAGLLHYKHWAAAVHPADLPIREAGLQRVVAEKGEGSAEFRIITKDLAIRNIAAAERVILDESGNASRVVGVNVDITERRESETALRIAKEAAEAANKVKSEFLANISHEIRTPMNHVLGMIEVTLDTEMTAEQREYLEIVRSSADDLMTILNDILDFSRIESRKLVLNPIDFNPHDALGDIAKAVASRAQQKGLELVVDIEADIPQTLNGDVGRLRQIVVNLLGNAIKFTEQGEVVLRVWREASASANDVRLHVSVKDTGIGIAHGLQKKVFEAFTQADGSLTRRHGGLGLGLSIASQLVQLMGGTLSFKSEIGRGSTFDFTACFVLARNSSTLPPAADDADLVSLPILVVDDNATSRNLLQNILSGFGALPTLTATMAEALDALRLAEQSGRAFSLVITDSEMPYADGFILAETIKGDPAIASAAIVMLTSAGQRGDAVRCRSAGIAAYLPKPIKRSELRDAIRLALGAQGLKFDQPALITRHAMREQRQTGNKSSI